MLTETPQTSWFGRLVQSLAGLLLGPLCIIGGLFLLYFVDSQTNYAALARKAPVFEATSTTDIPENLPLVAISGKAKIDSPISDNLFLKPATFLAFSRTTQIFAWQETKNTKNSTDGEGKPIQETSTTYATVWTDRPATSENFEEPTGHENPTNIPISPAHQQQESFFIGDLAVKANHLQLPQPTQLFLSEQNVNTPAPTIIHENTLFTPKSLPATPLNPKIGDLKTTYFVVDAHNKDVTIFGKIAGKKLSPASLAEITKDSSDETFFRLFWGSARDGIATLEKEYNQALFWGHVITFIIFFMGFFMFLGPVSALVSGISLFSSLFDTIIFVISLICATITFFAARLLIQILISPLLAGAICMALALIAALCIKFIKQKSE